MRDAFERLLRRFPAGGIAWLSRCEVVGIHVDKIVRNRRHPRAASFRRRSRAFPPSPNVATAEAVTVDLRNRAVATAREVRQGFSYEELRGDATCRFLGASDAPRDRTGGWGATLGRLQGLLDQPIDGLDTSWVQACAGAGHMRGEDL